jgi:hypothetical protein
MIDKMPGRNPAEPSFDRLGYAWAPSGLVAGTGKQGCYLSLALGALSVALAVTSTLPLVGWLAAVIGAASGLAVLLPHTTRTERLLGGLGMVLAVVAMVILLA